MNEITYTPEATSFKLWAPTADEVLLRIYDAGMDGNLLKKNSLNKACHSAFDAEFHSKGIADQVRNDGKSAGFWNISLTGDYNGKFYTFEIRIGEKWYGETPGIFAKAVGVNGLRGAIIDLEKTIPKTGKMTNALH